MTHGRGVRSRDYRAPLFFAWQVTNRCSARCLHCCEESGPDKAWPDELTREEALSIARQVAKSGVAFAAFGGGEPLDVPFIWEIFDILHASNIAIRIETNGHAIDGPTANRLKSLGIESLQISLDGPDAATHEKVRPGTDFGKVIRAFERVTAVGLDSEAVFVPTRLNNKSGADTLVLAAKLGVKKFVTGPMMRLGRAGQAWQSLSLSPEEWGECLHGLENAAKRQPGIALVAYPWDILGELRARRQSPQAMLLMVPNGKVKLLNALPFACADLKKQSLAEAWDAYQDAWEASEVQDFVERALADPGLLRHSNECWDIPSLHGNGAPSHSARVKAG